MPGVRVDIKVDKSPLYVRVVPVGMCGAGGEFLLPISFIVDLLL